MPCNPQYTGFIDIATGGTYTFYTESDDGSRLYIDGTLVVDNDGLHAMRERSGQISLSDGMHVIEITFFEKGGGADLITRYEGPGVTKQVIPDNVLYTASSAVVTIDEFSVNPAEIAPGETSILTWQTSNATSVTLYAPNSQPVAEDGSLEVSPTSTVDYTLVAYGEGGPISRTATLTVTSSPSVSIDDFHANPTTITEGGSTTLYWETSNATSVTLDGATVSNDGSQTVSPTATTTYTLTAQGNNGPVSQSVTVTVDPLPSVSIDNFYADPSTITEGEGTRLYWQTSNATLVTINGNSVIVDGTMSVSPSATINYILTAHGNNGPVSQTITVTVNPVGTTVWNQSGSTIYYSAGNVGIGTDNPQQTLDVDGTIRAEEIIVETVGGADYVFANDYLLRSLSEVEAFIQEHRHLPGISSENDMVNNGIDLKELNLKLLEKVEELTLYAIELHKDIAELKKQINGSEK